MLVPIRTAAATAVASTSARAFASSPRPSTSTLSRLNKTTLLRQARQARNPGSKSHKNTKDDTSMTLADAAKALQALSPATPNAAYEITISLKPAATIQLNALRGRVFLPHSSFSATKSSLVVVFASGPAVALAKSAGADRVGGEELVAEILNGTLVPDKLITTPELLGLFTRNPTLARFLGPKGLMPSAKRGTVAEDVVKAVKEARGGLDWKGDSKGVVRAAIGRLHFTPEALQENVHTMLASVSDIALGGTGEVTGVPVRTKRPAVTRVLLSSTQGPGLVLSDVVHNCSVSGRPLSWQAGFSLSFCFMDCQEQMSISLVTASHDYAELLFTPPIGIFSNPDPFLKF